jgi:hypothetical protein
MNIIVDRPQLVKVVKLYLTKNFGNLTPKTSKFNLDSVFYVNSDNEILMEYDKEYNFIYVSYVNIFSKLLSYFPINQSDIYFIIKDWLEEHYQIYLETLKHLKIYLPSQTYWGYITLI